MKRIINLAALLFLGTGFALGQTYVIRPNMGPSILLGDLGGNFEQAKLNVTDYDWRSTRFQIGGDFLWGLGKSKGRFSLPNNYLVLAVNFSRLHASDLESYNQNKVRRGLVSDVTCFEANTLFEKQFSPANLRPNSKHFFIPMIFVGVGIKYASPKITEKGDTKYTENIGNSVSAQLPYGVGLDYQLAKNQRLGLQFYSVRSTTDLVDGINKQGNPDNLDNHIFLKITYSALLEKVKGGLFPFKRNNTCPRF